MEKTKKHGKLKIVLIAIVVLVIVGGIGACASPTVEAPDTVGKTGLEAEKIFNDAGFNSVAFNDNEGNIIKGSDLMLVVKQDPSANTATKTATIVTLSGDTYTEYFESLLFRPISEYGSEISNLGFETKVYSITGMELGNDLGEVARTSTGQRWCTSKISVDTDNKVVTMTVDSIEHAKTTPEYNQAA